MLICSVIMLQWTELSSHDSDPMVHKGKWPFIEKFANPFIDQ